MADYVYLKNMSQVGDIAISRRIFVDIATEATNRVIGASVAKTRTKSKLLVMLYHPVTVTFHQNGKVEIKIAITLKKGADANKICLAIQQEVAESLLAYTESIAFDVKIKVASIA